MKRILLVGSGAREHIIAEKIKESSEETHLVVIGSSMNPGIKKLAQRFEVGSVTDGDLALKLAKEEQIDFAVMGPEAPIAAGVVDALKNAGIPSFGPMQTVGRLESSKSFTRDLLAKYGIKGNPLFKVFYEEVGLKEYIEELKDYVVKADGLKGGKGVMVSGDHLKTIDEGYAYALECLREAGKVLIEEKFVGQEFSYMSFCDGVTNVFMPVVQDHKRAYVGDTGPNTGGMGSYSCSDHSMPFLTEQDLAEAREITNAVAKALHEETGVYFKGIMYGGFIATKNGVRLIEYNARFGDPEAMNVLSLLQSDFVALSEKLIAGELTEADAVFAREATVCKYVVPNGYPDNPVKDVKIELSEMPEGVKAYFASVDEREDGLYLCGSRAVGVIAKGASLEEAEELAERACAKISGPVFHREDIGTAALIEARVQMMKSVRG